MITEEDLKGVTEEQRNQEYAAKRRWKSCSIP